MKRTKLKLTLNKVNAVSCLRFDPIKSKLKTEVDSKNVNTMYLERYLSLNSAVSMKKCSTQANKHQNAYK